MPRLIDAFELSNAVIESMNNNPHADSIVRKAHKHEHEHFLKMIQLAPTIEVAPIRHGQWVDKMVRDWHCSECGKKASFDGYYYDDKPSYCPNCGAKMDKEE